MPEPKKVQLKPPEPAPTPAPALVDASTATDPAVHQLLARRDVLEQEDRRARAAIEAAQVEIEGRKVQHEAVNAQLKALGYR